MLELLPEDIRLFLFDSFDGLPENWKSGFEKGHFHLHDAEVPSFSDKRVQLITGQFSNVLPVWKSTVRRPLAFVHIDCDLYSSTKTVLNKLNEYIVPGTLIVFDEYFVPELENDEMTAFLEFASEYRKDFRYLAHAQNGSVSVLIQ